MVLLTSGNMEHDLRFNELLMPCLKVHQQASLDNLVEKQKMENELIMRVFSLMWKCIRNLRSCGDLKNYIDLAIPSAIQSSTLYAITVCLDSIISRCTAGL